MGLKNVNVKSIIIDSTLGDSINKLIEFRSSRNFSQFRTPIEVKFFEDGILSDSIVNNAFSMASWYSIQKDTIDLVSHVGDFETQALLVRFINGKPSAFFYRAPHDVGDSRNFKVNVTDSFSHSIEVAPIRLDLRISAIPDSFTKPVIFGYVDMESAGYYDRRDSSQRKLHVKLKFNFRSNIESSCIKLRLTLYWQKRAASYVLIKYRAVPAFANTLPLVATVN